MAGIEARVWRKIIFTGLAIAAIGLSCGCAGETIAVTPPFPSSSPTSDETALLTESSVVLHFNPGGSLHNTLCYGVPIEKNANVIDVLTAGTCVPLLYMDGKWGNQMELRIFNHETLEVEEITPLDAKGAMDSSGLALVTMTLKEADAVRVKTIKMAKDKLSPDKNYELIALLNTRQVRGIAPARNSSEFEGCEESSELKRMAWQPPAQANILTETDIASRDWFYFRTPASKSVTNNTGLGVFNPETNEVIGVMLDTIGDGMHFLGTGDDCNVVLYPNAEVVQSLLNKNHAPILSDSR